MVGTTVEAGGSYYTVNEVRDPALPSRYADLDADERLVAADITQGGIEDGDRHSGSYFHVQDVDGYVYDGSAYGGELEPSFDSGTLLRGQRTRGWVFFEVPKTATLVSVLAGGYGVKTLIARLTPDVTPPVTVIARLRPDATPAEVVEWAKNGVVRIIADYSGGSGFIFARVGETAFVATNEHVIEGARSIDVIVNDVSTYKAALLGFNSDKDVAVLAICCDAGFRVLDWGPGAAPAISTQIVAIGYPRAAEASVVSTTGEIAGEDPITQRHRVIAHTAPLNPGNSGGPLLSMDGKVLGLNVGSSTFQQEAVYYAVPYGTVAADIEKWKNLLIVEDALVKWDDNGDGRITCAEAEAHGIAPVRRGHSAYQYMEDRDDDGVVCE